MVVYGFIYITTNLVNGKKYLGQRKYSNGWEDYLGSGILLKKALTKYGKENFKREIIVEAETREELNKLEFELIELHNCRNSELWYNIFKGGMGGSLKGEDSQNFGRVQTEDHKSKISQGTRNGYKNPFYCIDIFTGEIDLYNNNAEYGKGRFYINEKEDLQNMKLSNKTKLLIRKELYYKDILEDASKQNNFIHVIDIDTLDIKTYIELKDIKLFNAYRFINLKRIVQDKYIVVYMKDYNDINKLIEEYKYNTFKFEYRNGIVLTDINSGEKLHFKSIVDCANSMEVTVKQVKSRVLKQVKSPLLNLYTVERMN